MGMSSSFKSGDYLEGMLSDYVGGGKGSNNKLNKSASARTTSATSSAKLVTVMTCLQFAFAFYVTFLLYYMSPTIDLRTKPNFISATRFTQNWKRHFVIPPHVVDLDTRGSKQQCFEL